MTKGERNKDSSKDSKKKGKKHFKERCKRAQNSEANTIQLNIKCKVKHLQLQTDRLIHKNIAHDIKLQNQVDQGKGITSCYYQRWH